MTTSNSIDYSLDANGIITAAFEKLGIRTAESPLEAPDVATGLRDLNLMLKTWVMDSSVHLWTTKEGIIFLDKGKTDYLLGATGDEATTLDDFIGTTTTADMAALDIIAPVTSSVGMLAGDYVGLLLDTGIRHWTTIFSVDTATQISLTVGVPSVVTSGKTVFTFTSLIERPLRITSSRRKTYGKDNEIPIESWPKNTYFNQVNKETQGTVVSAYYSPLLTNGRYYVWQTASSANDYIRITFERTIEDVDLESETLDIPQEWHECVIYNLAARLLDSYKVPPQKEQSITSKAGYFLDVCLGWDQEIESIDIYPEFD